MKGAQVKERFVQLRTNGLSFDKTSKELNVSKPILIKWQKELEKQITELKFFECEVMSEEQLESELLIQKLEDKKQQDFAENCRLLKKKERAILELVNPSPWKIGEVAKQVNKDPGLDLPLKFHY